jgi:hypothetical protein
MAEADVQRIRTRARVVPEGAAARDQQVEVARRQRRHRRGQEGQGCLQSHDSSRPLQKASAPRTAADGVQRHEVRAVDRREESSVGIPARQQPCDTLGAACLRDVVVDDRRADNRLRTGYQAPRIEITAGTVRSRISRSELVERRMR